jgi:hypothetical protein
LPAALKEIVERSLRLHQRIMTLDAMLNAPQQPEAPAASPVSEQLDRLASAFKVARG